MERNDIPSISNTNILTKEKKFYDELAKLFVGEKIEGNSGYINLMKIKSQYFNQKVFPYLYNIGLKFNPEFKEEFYEKLYSFFSRYFSETGSIYFKYTPLKQKIYEKIYDDDKDVALFWKTAPLYYIKTDRLLNNMELNVEGYNFVFDVSGLVYKKAYEKRDIVYYIREITKDNKKINVVFDVKISEKGRKTNFVKILQTLNKNGVNINEDSLKKAIRIFEKQNEVDYFINKDAEKFLKEQFDLWFYQYIFSEETKWSASRLNQLQLLKNFAFEIINFIAQFENELMKIWNKPKFVLNSNYLITLNKIAEKEGGLLIIEKILNHKNIQTQLKEWINLGFISINNKDLNEFEIINFIVEANNIKKLNPKYQFLPIDTSYFKDLEYEILNLFDNLDEEIDGWLIKSENYQALNTILPKFKEKIQLIYIDPPYNTGYDEFLYKDKFKHSSWLTLMENRLQIAKQFLKNDGFIYISIDWNESHRLKLLMDMIFGEENFQREIIWNTGDNISGFKSRAPNWIRQHDTIYFYTKNPQSKISNKLWTPINLEEFNWTPKSKLDLIGPNKNNLFLEKWKNGQYIKEKINNNNVKAIGDIWNDIYSFQYSFAAKDEGLAFTTQKPQDLIRRIIQASTQSREIILDFFLGSATTCVAAQKLNRKWIGIEMGDYFEDIIIPRIKKVLFGEQSGISKKVNWKGGGFIKYYYLEQYEDCLKKAKYYDIKLDDLHQKNYSSFAQYNQYLFLKDIKLLDFLEIDYKNNKVKADFSKLYKDIDLAETFSNFLGKWINKITQTYVEFQDGIKISLKNLDYKLIKPLIWW
ncbi:MAG: site-specific DNA-methyltransferase [Promethearchaeota archaeon]